MKRINNNPLDSADVQSQSFNEQAGGFKHLPIGPKLKYLGTASSATVIGEGKQIAIFTASSATVTMGDSSVTSLALGSGGIPLIPNVWNYLSMGSDKYIVASAATVYIFEISDDTYLR